MRKSNLVVALHESKSRNQGETVLKLSNLSLFVAPRNFSEGGLCPIASTS